MRAFQTPEVFSYAAEKIRQGIGYRTYLNTLDSFQQNPGITGAFVGSMVGYLNFTYPITGRFFKKVTAEDTPFKKSAGIFMASIGADSLAWTASSLLLPALANSLPQEVRQIANYIPPEQMPLAAHLIKELSRGLLMNTSIHMGIDAIRRRYSISL